MDGSPSRAGHRLRGVIAPRSVALIGGSERNHLSVLAMRAIRGIGFDGRLHMVNRRGADTFGLPWRSAKPRGSDLAAFEVNPPFVRGDRIEAVDAMAVWTVDEEGKLRA